MLQCQVCNRSYERIDHLNRHLDSHRNERSFRCDDCPAAFNRRLVSLSWFIAVTKRKGSSF
ncbi:hypothetical protein GQ44DRAFT_607764 [Phaeosphaeriaceae sp. PMI808]|nr:hypothetical protein GQ44DRAFT_607764 [Phaeosphaeriaceae sp. PMI808]